jgi:hypothetical protein
MKVIVLPVSVSMMGRQKAYDGAGGGAYSGSNGHVSGRTIGLAVTIGSAWCVTSIGVIVVVGMAVWIDIELS